MIDHMLRAACCRCRCLRARPDTTEITYEVREGAQIEPAPHFFAPALRSLPLRSAHNSFIQAPVRRAGERPSGRGHALLDLYGRARRRTVAVWVPRVSCERASYRMAGTAAVVAGL